MSDEAVSKRQSSYAVASIGLTREVNRAAIFRMIGIDGPIARATIARRLSLSPATVTAVTRELLEQGLVRVAERSQARRGRPSMLLEVAGDAARAFGVKVAADHVVGVSVDLEAEIVQRYEAPFEASAPDAVARLGELLAGWTAAEGGSSPLLGIGLGVSGVVDPIRGTVDSPLLGWEGVPLAADLRRRFHVPVLVDNDVNTLAVAERLYGRGRGSEHFLTVTLGHGIGLGVIAGGDIYRGHGGGAGEFGHTTARLDGPRCTCGKRGCLEAIAADPALVAQGRRARLLKAGEGIEQLRAHADGGNEKARSIFRSAGAAL